LHDSIAALPSTRTRDGHSDGFVQLERSAGLETCDTAGLEACATSRATLVLRCWLARYQHVSGSACHRL